MDYLYPAFAENVEKMSGGRLLIEVYASGEVAAAGAEFDALRTGMLDIAMPWPSYHVGVVPAGELEAGVCGGLSDTMEVETLFWKKGWAEIFQEVYAPLGVKYLGPSLCYGGYYLVTREPITSLADIKGLKIRAIPPQSTLLAKLGASIVYVPWGEVYLALATGTIDGAVIGDVSDTRDLKIHEFAPYHMVPRLAEYSNCNYSVNMDVWNSLPEDLQHILLVAAWEHSKQSVIVGIDENLKAWAEISAEGAEKTYLPDADIARLRVAAMEALDEIAAADPVCARLAKIYKDFMRELGYFD
jgi:TRAP-type mannitol/chloroaromatic compound transport system substrate-binding protein